MVRSGFTSELSGVVANDMRRSILKLTGASLVAAGLTACASQPVTSQVRLVIAAATDVNPDGRGRPSPVSVRVYALKSSTIFESADFFSLYEKDATTLGQDVVRREELLLRPGESKPIDMILPADAKVLAVLAAFRDLEHARWRLVRQIDVGKPAMLRVKLAARQIAVE